MSNGPTRARLATSATRVLAVIGFVALIGVGMWGSVSVARAVPGTLSSIAAAIVSITSIFVPSNESLVVTTPNILGISGEPVTVSFDHKSKSVKGSYAFRYSCVDGVTITTGTVAGATDTISCATPYPIATGATSIIITPTSANNRFADVEVFVAFTPEGAGTPTITGSTAITIENADLTKSPATTGTTGGTTVPTPKPTPKPGTPSTPVVIQVPTTKPSDPNGYVDLAPRVIEVGILDSTGAFVASSTPNRRDRVAVRFAIENIGTKTSKEFTFSAVLPTYPSYTYFSQSQPVLNPGDRIEYTIGFDAVKDADSGDFVVNVDPTGSVNERNKDNNIIHYTVYVVR